MHFPSRLKYFSTVSWENSSCDGLSPLNISYDIHTNICTSMYVTYACIYHVYFHLIYACFMYNTMGLNNSICNKCICMESIEFQYYHTHMHKCICTCTVRIYMCKDIYCIYMYSYMYIYTYKLPCADCLRIDNDSSRTRFRTTVHYRRLHQP